ncbi:energy transducer TonB [Parvibium lacunae]|uniref:Energy transducer TonB n=1 Tax=Parvibium lacunae TaxID=1888893 RepID=A0A368L464_9BURK|nr:energy transducer TonB [Parvibium lacunae]RCS58376.1 energy transducer TonB [Parvibium lacunae]
MSFSTSSKLPLLDRSWTCSSRLEKWPGGLCFAVVLHGLAWVLFLQYRAPLASLNADIPVMEVVDAALPAAPTPPSRQPKVTPALKPALAPALVSKPVPAQVLPDTPSPIPLASATPINSQANNAATAPSNASASHTSSSQNPSLPSVSQAPAAQPKVVTQGIAYLVKPDPQYPPLARRAGEEGTALIRVLVNTEGRPEEANVQQSSGFNRLDEAARKAVLAARFRPHQENGQAIRVWTLVPISFTLEN